MYILGLAACKLVGRDLSGLAIFSVTRSPAVCRSRVASVRDFPIVVIPLIANKRSPTCIAPVLLGIKTKNNLG